MLKQSAIDLTEAQYVWNAFFNINSLRQADKIVSHKGRGKFEYYYEMIDTDGKLAGLVENRINGVACLGWDVKPISDDETDKEIAVFVKWALRRISQFDDDIADILAACVTGYSVSEVVWGDAEYEGKSVLVPAKILSMPVDAFRFGDNRELRLLDTGNYEGTDVNDKYPMKFITYSFRKREENPYGVSLLRSIYWLWFFKHQVLGYWLRACEVGAEITPVFRYAPNTSETEISEMAESAQLFLKSKYIVCPESCTIEFPGIRIDPEMASVFKKTLDTEMAFRFEGSELSTGTAESGTRALGEVHETQPQNLKERDAKSLEAIINETLIKWIVLLNIGEISEYPTFKLNYETEEDMAKVRENIKVALDYGVPLAQAYVAERLNLRLAQEGEPLCIKVPVASPFGSGGLGNPSNGGEALPFSAGDRPKKVMGANAPTIKQEMINLEEGAIRGGKKVIENIRKQAEDWIGSFGDLSEAEKEIFEPDLSELADYTAQARFLAKLYGMYRVYGIKRIADKLGTRKAVRASADDWIPLPFSDAIDRFKKRKVLTRKQFDLLSEAEKNQALTAMGMSKETIQTMVRAGILSALEEGTTFADFRKTIGDVAMSKAHAENIFRTNVQSAYNSGHAEAMYDPALKDDIPGFQFVAIPDDRICEICEPLDGLVYERSEMESEAIVPPLHYMCRCTIIPVFADEYSGPSENRPDINNLEGFGSWQSVLE
jgi:SPP1 gp7 family putative phage head morphogenesis protein